MQTIWDEFAEVVGRVLAERWIRRQEAGGTTRRVDSAAQRQSHNRKMTKSNGVTKTTEVNP